MTVSAPSDPFAIIHSLASISPPSLFPSSRIAWLLGAFSFHAPSSIGDHDVADADSTITPAVDPSHFFRARIWVQKDCAETEYFVPFNDQGEFVMFSDEDHQGNGDGDQPRFDLLVPRYKYRVCIIHAEQQRHTIRLQNREQIIVQSGSLINAYCYLDYSWKLCTVQDIVGVVDESGDIHVLSSRPYSHNVESMEGMVGISPFGECTSAIQRVVGERDVAILMLLCLISTP